MRTYINSIAVICFVLVLSQGCGNAEPEKQEAAAEEQNFVELTDQQIATAGIDTGRAQLEAVHSTLTVNGVVDVPPQNIVSVSFPLGGYLKSTRLLPGMRIRRGDVLAVVEDQALIQLQQDYLIARSRLDYLKQDLERQQYLNENKVNADKTLQLARSEYESQQAVVKGLSEKLQLVGLNPAQLSESSLSRSVPLRSPINGYVSKVNVNIGKYVNSTDVLFELINPDDMHAALMVFEKDMGKLRVGQKVRMNLVDAPDQSLDGEILLFTHNIDDDRSGTVHCHFEKPAAHLMPGMFLNATIYLDERKAWTLPEQAVVRYGGKSYVFRQAGAGRFEMVEVQSSAAGNGRLVIESPELDPSIEVFALKNAYALLGKLKNSAEED